ncbi:MAG: hypothetical protein NDI84_02670 [Steroidobacteraceae bacterium]|nr:hypothetical protein [Steroidobacteraceae bacterium]
MPPLQQLLASVQRHLLRERLAAAARYAAWGTVLVALVGVLLHLVVRPVSPLGLLAALGLPWLLALLQVITTRARPVECAAWADRHLGGRSAYATCLETAAVSRDKAAPAFAHLDAWIAQAAPTHLAQLAGRPFDANLRKPLSAALVCVALAMALLQLPTRAHPPSGESDAAANASKAGATGQPAAERREGSERVASTDAPGDRDANSAPQEPRSDAARTPVVATDPAAVATDDSPAATAETEVPAQAAARVNTTGREAGDNADTGDGTSLTAPWQGPLAARLRQVAGARDREEMRADPSRTADYAASAAVSSEAPAHAALTAAAANPPPAGTTSPLGPAEQAYLRAYFATDTGAAP